MKARTEPHPEARIAPVKLVWSAEQNRLIEQDERGRAHKAARKLGGAAARAADAVARKVLLRKTTERLSPAIQAAMQGHHFGLELVDKEVGLPIVHAAGDKNNVALDESYQMRGTDSKGDVVLTRAPGLLSHNLIVAHAMRAKHDRERAAAGKGWVDRSPRHREDRRIQDPGSTLYLVSPADLAAAKAAEDKVWSTITPEDALKSKAIEAGWGLGIDLRAEDIDEYVGAMAEMDKRPARDDQK